MGSADDRGFAMILNEFSYAQERVTNLREHREFEKEFEVKTALTGERNLERGADVSLTSRNAFLPPCRRNSTVYRVLSLYSVPLTHVNKYLSKSSLPKLMLCFLHPLFCFGLYNMF